MIEDIGHKAFKGSRRDRKIRKGLVDLIIPNAAGPRVFDRLFQSMMQNMDYFIKDASGNNMGGVRIIPVSQGEHGSHDLLRSLQKSFPDTVFPVFKEFNRPPPIPYNDGLEYSARMMPVLSEYIMFLDDDMVMLKPGLIQLERNYLETNGFDNVATEHCYFGDKSKLGPLGESKDFGMGSFFFRRKLFEKVGYLDEFFQFHCSDTDFNKRIRLLKGKIAVIPKSEQFMFHEHQAGTHNFFRGNHQRVIDSDWVLFAKKWKEGHKHNSEDEDINFDCEECKNIAQRQLPLGRKEYIFE